MSRQGVILFYPRPRFYAQLQRSDQSRYDLDELEWSDYGRDPRFLPGWWIVPMCFLAVLSVGIA